MFWFVLFGVCFVVKGDGLDMRVEKLENTVESLGEVYMSNIEAQGIINRMIMDTSVGLQNKNKELADALNEAAAEQEKLKKSIEDMKKQLDELADQSTDNCTVTKGKIIDSSMSSLWYEKGQYSSEKAYDDAFLTTYARSHNEMNPWFKAELGKTVEIMTIELWLRNYRGAAGFEDNIFAVHVVDDRGEKKLCSGTFKIVDKISRYKTTVQCNHKGNGFQISVANVILSPLQIYDVKLDVKAGNC